MSEKPENPSADQISDNIVETVKRHADLILRASGSGLRHYTLPKSRLDILAAVMDCYEEAYRAGVAFAQERSKS